MNEKINIQNLTDGFSESYGISKKDAEAFVKEFFSVIQEGLEKDKYVKIKGFGTFKLIDVDSRESINVNTGERIEIQGHSKITFTPDHNIKEAVNKPFSAFQTVALADGVSIDALEDNLADEAALDDFAEDEPVEEFNQKESDIAEQPVVVEETPVEEPVILEEPEEEESAEEVPAEFKILPIFDDEAIKKKDQPVSHQQEVMALKLSEEKRNEISKKAEISATPYLMFFAVLAIMACLGVVAYLYYPDLAKVESTSATPISALKQPTDAGVKPVIDDDLTDTAIQDNESTATNTSAEAQMQTRPETSEKKEVTEPLVVREESVPAIAQSQNTDAQTSTARQTTSAKPATEQKQADKSSTSITRKVGNQEYSTDGEIETHVLAQGETLFALSRKYYGANALYIFIVDYNKDVIKDPDNVPTGTKLRIPKLVKK